MTTLQKQQLFEQIIYATIALLIFATPFINALLMAYQTDGNTDILHTALDMWVITSPFFFLFLINNYILIPQLLLKRQYAGYMAALVFIIPLLFIIVPELIRLFHLDDITRQPSRMMPPPPPPAAHNEGMHNSPFPPFVTFTHILIAVLLAGFNIAIRLFLKSLRDDEMLKELERERLKAELKYLKYQLNPHFFMNTLNNIHTLIGIDKEKAQKSIIELSKLMQYMLYEADKVLVPLTREVQFLEHYLKLMELRYTDKLHIAFHTPFIIPDVQVPPLLFISLLENAFTHGISHRNESFIEAAISIEGNNVYFTCKNSLTPKTLGIRHQGIGLPNIQKRLNLLFDNDYTLNAEEKDNQYHVLLIIPAQ